MKIIFEQDEIQRIYTFTKELDCAGANKIFNALFTEEHHEMIDLVAIQGNSLELTVDKDIAATYIDVFIKNAYQLAVISKKSGLSLLTAATNVGKEVLIDLRIAQNIANKIWKNKHPESKIEICQNEDY